MASLCGFNYKFMSKQRKQWLNERITNSIKKKKRQRESQYLFSISLTCVYQFGQSINQENKQKRHISIERGGYIHFPWISGDSLYC
jgi:hypothetical protein